MRWVNYFGEKYDDYNKVNMKNRKYLLSAICYLLFISFWLFTIRQAVLGQLGGTFALHSVPEAYVALKNFLVTQPEFSRSLWVPRQSRFAFSSSLHPAVEAQPLFAATSSAMFLDYLRNFNAREKLASISIRYVIVPSDPLGEIFVEDRRYDNRKRKEFVDGLDKIFWLEKLPFVGIDVYQISPYGTMLVLRTKLL